MPTQSELRVVKRMPKEAPPRQWSDVGELTSRMKRIEQTIHRLTTSPALTEAQRIELLGLLAGTRNGRIDPKHVPNTPAEQRLVDNFRAMSTNHRRLASLLFAALGKERRA